MRGRETADDSVSRSLRHDYWGVVLEAPDAQALAEFYSALLGWELELADDDPDFATVAARDGVAYVGFQTARAYSWSFWSHSRVRAWSRMWTLRS